jgi:predicted DNA-binding protein
VKRRGGYRGDLIHQVKVRVSPNTLTKLQDLSEQRDRTLAFLIREFIYQGLAALKP